jgi:hypothetical protein
MVKLELINEEGEKVGRQMRGITTGVELHNQSLHLTKKTSTQILRRKVAFIHHVMCEYEKVSTDLLRLHLFSV